MKVFGSIKDKAGSAGKKVLDVTGWIVMFIAIMAVVGVGGFIITAVVVNYQTLWAMISDGASQILSDHWGLIILINALVIGGVTIFFISNDKKGVFNWEKVAKGKLIAGFACLIVFLNVVFFAIVVSYIKWDAIVRTFWGTISNELVWKTIISCEVMILLVIIFFVLRIKAEKKSGGSHA